MLDILIFPDEMSLSETEFWQAYRNWLSLIDLIADSIVANGWREHHAHMMADKSFSLWFPAWREHDRLLWAKFMINLFMVNPNHSSYVHQFEHCRGDQTHNDTITVASSSKKEPFLHQAHNTNAMPYNKNAPRYSSFRMSLCVHYGTSGHKVSNCQAEGSTIFNRPIIVDWKADRLLSKSGKQICLMFNVRGACSNFNNGTHGAHLCSLCGNVRHSACNCLRN